MHEHDRRVWEEFGAWNRTAWRRNFREEDGPWFETRSEIRGKLRYGREKKRLLVWVRMEMLSGFSVLERQCVELYHFRGLSYREISEILGAHPSSVYRAVLRAVRKLRRRAEAQGGAVGILMASRSFRRRRHASGWRVY
ncbi:MAG: helix-turn-helix domain-containing protein [Candidatus Hydrogenedentes bacterium]|nr:helix-turn-helix domain-containing protein [Candidatus Hydrogenedentota bacterium]